MKKLINDPAEVIDDALRGMAIAHPGLRIDHDNRIVYRGDAPVARKVGLISGGGSGHEPLHGGFVGAGMLDAACAGEVFTSPVPDQMLEATKNVDSGAGVVHIVKNYTGDVMNFEMAAELAAAEDITVESVILLGIASPGLPGASACRCSRPGRWPSSWPNRSWPTSTSPVGTASSCSSTTWVPPR